MIFFAFAIAGIGPGRHDWSERRFGFNHQLRTYINSAISAGGFSSTIIRV